jgi:hypothetical protein
VVESIAEGSVFLTLAGRRGDRTFWICSVVMLAGGGAAAAAPGGMDMACCIAAALALVLLLPLGCWIRWGVAFSLALLFFEVVKPG